MSLINNLNKAKRLIDQQKGTGKLSGMVDKATDAVDKATKGKSTKLTEKIDTAVKKFDSSGTTHSGRETPAATESAGE